MEAALAEDHKKKVALIVGVTGMAGLGLAEALKSPTSLGGPWEVYGASRRAKPTWFPSSIVDHYITFDALDSKSTYSKLAPLSGHITHVFWVAIQVRENEQQNVLANSEMLSNVLNVLLTLPCTSDDDHKARPSALRHITIQTGTKQYMGPINDPILSTQLPKPDIPFKENAKRLPYPNFYYALEDLVASYVPKITYSIHRSSIILGASSRSFYNMLLTVGVYAEICKYEHTQFKYPGTKYTWNHFCDVSDSRLLAEQQIWAAVASQEDDSKVKNEAFNCTNGDVFTWRSMWMVLCEVFGVEFVEFEDNDDDGGRFDWVGTMNEKGWVWDRIVLERGLYRTKMEEITCFPAANVVLHFEFQHVCSMNKSKELGFLGFVDSLKSVRFWVDRLREMNILPRLIETEAEPV